MIIFSKTLVENAGRLSVCSWQALKCPEVFFSKGRTVAGFQAFGKVAEEEAAFRMCEHGADGLQSSGEDVVGAEVQWGL